MMTISEDEFDQTFLPFRGDENTTKRFETYWSVPEFTFLKVVNKHYLWTQVEFGDEVYYLPGWRHANATALLITLIPWTDEQRDTLRVALEDVYDNDLEDEYEVEVEVEDEAESRLSGSSSLDHVPEKTYVLFASPEKPKEAIPGVLAELSEVNITEDAFYDRYQPLTLHEEESVRFEDYEDDPQKAFLESLDEHYVWSHVGSPEAEWEGFRPGRDASGRHANIVTTVAWTDEEKDRGLCVKYDDDPPRHPDGSYIEPPAARRDG